MPTPLRYNQSNTMVGDLFSPITDLNYFVKGSLYFAKGSLYRVISMNEQMVFLNGDPNGMHSISWPYLSACFSKYNPNNGELDPLPEPEERKVKAEYVSDNGRYLASIGAKSKHMIPDEIREQRELAETKKPPVTVRRRIIPEPGKYGEVELVSSSDDKVSVRISPAFYLTSEQLREAAHVLNQLAEIVEGNARNG